MDDSCIKHFRNKEPVVNLQLVIVIVIIIIIIMIIIRLLLLLLLLLKFKTILKISQSIQKLLKT